MRENWEGKGGKGSREKRKDYSYTIAGEGRGDCFPGLQNGNKNYGQTKFLENIRFKWKKNKEKSSYFSPNW